MKNTCTPHVKIEKTCFQLKISKYNINPNANLLIPNFYFSVKLIKRNTLQQFNKFMRYIVKIKNLGGKLSKDIKFRGHQCCVT